MPKALSACVRCEVILGTLNQESLTALQYYLKVKKRKGNCTATETPIQEQTTMGLFDTVLGKQKPAQEFFSPAEAFAAITLAAVASDGYLADDEARGISAALSRMKLFRSYSNDVMGRLFDKLLGILRQDGINTLFNAAKESLPQDLRETAFAVATDLVLADGTVTEEEQNFLNDLYQALGISSEIALQIVQVMSIKNQG